MKARRYIALLFIWIFLPWGSLDGFSGTKDATSASRLPDTARVLTINGEPVMFGEFMLLAGKLRPKVVAAYRNNYGLEYSGQFWTTGVNEQTPAETLKRLVVDTLIKIKVMQISARESGLVGDISYTGFRRRLEAENKRREADHRAGGVIYGPVRYMPDVYYSYLFTNLQVRLKEYLEGTQFAIDEDRLMSEYMRQKEILCDQGFMTRAAVVSFMPGAMAGNCPGNWIILAGLGFRLNTCSFNDTVPHPEEEPAFESRVRQEVARLDVGTCTPMLHAGTGLFRVLLLDRSALGVNSFARCRKIIRIILLNRMYDDYMDKLADGAVCHLNPEVYDQITF